MNIYTEVAEEIFVSTPSLGSKRNNIAFLYYYYTINILLYLINYIDYKYF